MIDLHTHTFFSDGALGPFELVYRSQVAGYKVIGITDHGDFSNMEDIIPRIVKTAKLLASHYNIKIIPGIELTYIPPKLMAKAVSAARKLGARIVVVHGETTSETVPPGTNRAGILAKADIIAHPGLILEEDVLLAKKLGVCLEITTRPSHSKTNKRVAHYANRCGAKLVLNTDSHMPSDFLSEEKIKAALKQSGLSQSHFVQMENNSYNLAHKCMKGK